MHLSKSKLELHKNTIFTEFWKPRDSRTIATSLVQGKGELRGLLWKNGPAGPELDIVWSSTVVSLWDKRLYAVGDRYNNYSIDSISATLRKGLIHETRGHTASLPIFVFQGYNSTGLWALQLPCAFGRYGRGFLG